ncbi:DUF6192 family protein [Streptomyces malaysiensis]|uniref:DUF6192 family protein n=1 Tax=Streptomyces malaysiensis TaxID=92644 RepID=UPI00369F017D
MRGTAGHEGDEAPLDVGSGAAHDTAQRLNVQAGVARSLPGVTAIHSLARDEEIAATVTTDFLKRPRYRSGVGANRRDALGDQRVLPGREERVRFG